MSTTQIHITLLDFKYLPKHYCDNIELYIYDLCKCMLQIKGPVAYGYIRNIRYNTDTTLIHSTPKIVCFRLVHCYLSLWFGTINLSIYRWFSARLQLLQCCSRALSHRHGAIQPLTSPSEETQHNMEQYSKQIRNNVYSSNQENWTMYFFHMICWLN